MSDYSGDALPTPDSLHGVIYSTWQYGNSNRNSAEIAAAVVAAINEGRIPPIVPDAERALAGAALAFQALADDLAAVLGELGWGHWKAEAVLARYREARR